jgi:thiol-disulfide isomerase/thioredoxin
MNTLPKSRNRIRFLVTSVLVATIATSLMAINGLYVKSQQESKYALPSDTSGTALLEFLRRMDGSGNAPKSIFETSNAESICKAVSEGYRALVQSKDGLTERELREADFYHLKYGALSMAQGFTPATDTYWESFLSQVNSFLRLASTFGAREREIMSLTISLLEGTDRIDQTVLFVDALREHLVANQELGANGDNAANGNNGTIVHLKQVSDRLKLRNQLLSLESSTLDQKSFNIESLRGKAVLIEFWGTRCAPCIADMPALKRIYNANRDRLEIVGICLTSEPARVENFVAEHGLNWIQLCDDRGAGWECNMRLAERFGVTGVPKTLLVDPQGRVVKFGVRPMVANKALDLETCLDGMFSSLEARSD